MYPALMAALPNPRSSIPPLFTSAPDAAHATSRKCQSSLFIAASGAQLDVAGPNRLPGQAPQRRVAGNGGGTRQGTRARMLACDPRSGLANLSDAAGAGSFQHMDSGFAGLRPRAGMAKLARIAGLAQRSNLGESWTQG